MLAFCKYMDGLLLLYPCNSSQSEFCAYRHIFSRLNVEIEEQSEEMLWTKGGGVKEGQRGQHER